MLCYVCFQCEDCFIPACKSDCGNHGQYKMTFSLEDMLEVRNEKNKTKQGLNKSI